MTYKNLRCILFVIIAIMIISFFIAGYQRIEIESLQRTNNDILINNTASTVNMILDKPKYLFEFLKDSTAWEEIEAVPYSQCYRHLINGINSDSDYIICKAI